MDAADSWSRLSAASKRHHSRYDLYLGFDEVDAGGEEEGSRADYPCPFCFEEFDIVGLCCHIDEEHPVEARNGVCPVCHVRFGMDMVAHITMEHGSFFKMQHRRRHRKGSSGPHSTISLLRKELRDGNLQSLLGGSSYTVASSSAAPDPLLSSFMDLPLDGSSKDAGSEPLEEISVIAKDSDEKVVESVEPSLSDKDQKERALRSEFVRDLVWSTIFDDTL